MPAAPEPVQEPGQPLSACSRGTLGPLRSLRLARRARQLWSSQSRLRTASLGLPCVASLPTCHFAPFGHQKRSENNCSGTMATQRGWHAATNAPKTSVSVSCALSLSLSLSLSDEPSHGSRNVGTSKQTKTMNTLLCHQQRRLSSRSLCNSGSQRSQIRVCLCSHQYSLQQGPPSTVSMRAALSVRRRRCHQVTQQLGCLHRQVFHKSRRSTIARPYHNASFSPSLPQLQPPVVSTHFHCNVLRAGIAR